MFWVVCTIYLVIVIVGGVESGGNVEKYLNRADYFCGKPVSFICGKHVEGCCGGD